MFLSNFRTESERNTCSLVFVQNVTSLTPRLFTIKTKVQQVRSGGFGRFEQITADFIRPVTGGLNAKGLILQLENVLINLYSTLHINDLLIIKFAGTEYISRNLVCQLQRCWNLIEVKFKDLKNNASPNNKICINFIFYASPNEFMSVKTGWPAIFNITAIAPLKRHNPHIFQYR